MNKNHSYSVSEIELGTPELKVEITKYSDTKPSDKSLIILAPTGGVTPIDKSFSRKFAQAGYDVYLIKHWTYDDDRESSDLELHQRLYTQAQKAIDIVLYEIKSPYIGMIGTSVGALHAEVSAAMQKRINSVFVIVGGAPIVDVIIHSDHKSMIKLKEKRQQRYHFKNDEDYRIALEKAFSLEPMALGDGHKTKDLGMSIGAKDETVPTESQFKLRDYWKPKLVISKDNDHFWTILKTWWSDDETILNFFEESYKSRHN